MNIKELRIAAWEAGIRKDYAKRAQLLAKAREKYQRINDRLMKSRQKPDFSDVSF